ncbi:MAG: HpcH/HpaI aldolase family protein [Candidatus Humimicrobiaceae bacterium]
MYSNLIRNFKRKIKNQPVFGPFSKSTDPAFIEIMGYSGFDFVILDMEHGPNGLLNMQNLIRAAQLTNIVPIVRVKEDNRSLMANVLDIGAAGIQVPHVKCAEDVKEIINMAKFAPLGMRGMCRFVRAADYSFINGDDYFKYANEALIIIQIEGREGIENLDSIIKQGGFDILFVGAYDLSQSLGVPGQVEHQLVEKTINEIVKKCKEKNIVVGNFNDNVQMAKKWINIGVKYISYSVDVGIFSEGCKTIVNSLK